MGLVEELGRVWDAESLAARVMRDADLFESSGGGVTLSGGEPLLQHEFAVALLERLPVHKAIETSGFASADVFTRVIDRVDYVMMDLKLIDSMLHAAYTGVDNTLILENARALRESGVPHVFRTPMIPGITDTEENLAAIRAFIGNSPHEKIPYNAAAGSKYPMLGREYDYKTPIIPT
jgi:pyruvate formate lyase activating enzyme